MVYVGLDVSLNSVAVCVIDREGQILKEASVASETSAISQCLQPWRDRIAKIGREAGPMSEWRTAGSHLLRDGDGHRNRPPFCRRPR